MRRCWRCMGRSPNGCLNRLDRARRVLQGLLDDDIPPTTVEKWVGAAMQDEAGMIWNGRSRVQEVYELAHLRAAVQAGPVTGLRWLAGEKAVTGQKIDDGRRADGKAAGLKRRREAEAQAVKIIAAARAALDAGTAAHDVSGMLAPRFPPFHVDTIRRILRKTDVI